MNGTLWTPSPDPTLITQEIIPDEHGITGRSCFYHEAAATLVYLRTCDQYLGNYHNISSGLPMARLFCPIGASALRSKQRGERT